MCARDSLCAPLQADPDEDIPENLECLVKRKEVNEDSVSEDYPDTSSESGSLSVDGEVTRLKQVSAYSVHGPKGDHTPCCHTPSSWRRYSPVRGSWRRSAVVCVLNWSNTRGWSWS